jgi:GAF domain-containing protein
MTVDKTVLDDLRSLSTQLNRQAYARPPVEGWLNSFLAMFYERFKGFDIQGIQVAQVVGNVAVQMGSVGNVPSSASEQYTLDSSSPISAAINKREAVSAPDSRVFPILVGEDAVGVLVAYTKTMDNETVEMVFTTIASQLGPAIMQDTRLVRRDTGRLSRQVEMMRSLYEATRTVGSVLEGSEVLNRGARSVGEALKADHVGVVVWDTKGEIGTVIAEYPNFGYVGAKVDFRGMLLQEKLRRDMKPIVVESVSESDILGNNKVMMEGLGIKGMLILPMINEDQLIGSIGLDLYDEGRTFTSDEIEAGMTLAAQIAIAVRNAQIYDEIRRRALQLEQIADLSHRVTSTFDQFKIFEIVKEETESLLEADLCTVALLSDETEQIKFYVLDRLEPTPVDLAAGDAALHFVMSNLEPVVMDDISGSDYPDYKLMANSGMKAAIIVPLIVGGQARGTYGVYHKQVGHYSSLDVAVLEQVGNQLAISLENARLYTREVQRARVEELMNRLSSGIQSRSDMQSVLLNSVQQMAEALNARRASVRLQLMPIQTENKASITDRIIGKLKQKDDK